MKQTNELGDYSPPIFLSILSPIYDAYLFLRGYGQKYSKEIIVLSNIFKEQDKQKILDVGCATGTLLIELKKLFPNINVTGLDPDKYSLHKAKRKMEKCNVDFDIINSLAENMPFKDNTFDLIFCINTFHHIVGEKKKVIVCKEIYRVLKPNGKFILVDFGHVKNKILNKILHIIYDFDNVGDNIDGILDEILIKTGFENIKIIRRWRDFRMCWQMTKEVKKNG